MCIYLKWLYTRLRAKLAVCTASAYTQKPTRCFVRVRGASCYTPMQQWVKGVVYESMTHAPVRRAWDCLSGPGRDLDASLLKCGRACAVAARMSDAETQVHASSLFYWSCSAQILSQFDSTRSCERPLLRFLSPHWGRRGLEATYAVHLRFIGKLVDLPVSDN